MVWGTESYRSTPIMDDLPGLRKTARRLGQIAGYRCFRHDELSTQVNRT